MIYVADSHALVWLAEGNPRLSARARSALTGPEAEIVVPTIVLAEIHHLYARQKIGTDVPAVLERLAKAAKVGVYPLDRAVADRTPGTLDIHDAIIVATALVLRDLLGETVAVITRDADIARSGLVETVW